jgi:hypothetical protein
MGHRSGAAPFPSKLSSPEYLKNKYTFRFLFRRKEIVMIGLKKHASGAALGLLWLAACGGGSPSPAPGTSPDQASSSLTITLTSEGVSPKTSSVSGNSSVAIVNGDSAPHQLASNPGPQQAECPELNSPTLMPGEEFIATIPSRNATCGFIDSLNPTDSNFQGTITVTTTDAGSGSGGGYGGGY